MEVNLTGAFLGARAAARVMGDGGRLIFTGSVLGERPRKGLAAYSASKAGLVGVAKGLALDLAPVGHHGERRGAGVVRLADGRRVGARPQALGRHDRSHRAAALGHLPDLAGAYQFLASEASAFITGTVLSVDGGYLLV